MASSSQSATAHDLRLALVVVAAVNDGSLLPAESDGVDVHLDELFRRGLLKTVRDFADEYVTVITDEGRAFVESVVKREVCDGEF